MGQSASNQFSYTISATPERHYSGVGTLFAGKKVATNGKVFPPVSVLVMNVGDSKGDQYVQEIKKLRSPDVIRFLDRIVVADKVWLVTEEVVPFEAVKETLTYSQLVLCMERVLHALHFMHTKAHLSHNNVSIASIFVHRNEDLGGILSFKLGGLESCSSRPSSDGKLSTHPQPPESPATGKKSADDAHLPIHCRDIWQLGFVLPQLLSSHDDADAVERLSKAMKSVEPALRPTAAQLLQDPFFSENLFLRCFAFLLSFRGFTSASKRSFFSTFDKALGQVSSRDLKESIMPLVAQTDVIVDVEAEPFWERLFADGSRSVKKKADRLDCGLLVSDFCEEVLPAVAELINSPVRARKAAILTQLPRLLPLLPKNVVKNMVLPNVLECLKDSETPLCLMAIESCQRLCATWAESKDEEGLAAVNDQILIELRSLGLDSNARVRQKVMEVMSFLILLYDRINGMLGIRVIIGGLGDPDADVVLASLEGLERMKNLMTAIVVVNVVLPGLVPLLMHKTESVRIRVVNLVAYLANFVGTAKDTKSWPDGATATSTPLIGSTRRKNLFLGSLVEVHAAQQKKNGETGELEDDYDDEEGDKSWSSWKSEQVPTVSGPRAQLFDGLELKKSPVSSRASEAPRKKDLAGREARSKSQETVMLPEKKIPEPEQVQSKPEPAVFVVPSPRGVRAEVPAKPSVVLPRPVSPPNPRRAQELEDLLKKASDSEEEKEPVVLGTIAFDDDDDDDDDDENGENDMMSLVLQSQKMRSDIIAGGGQIKPEKKEEDAGKSKSNTGQIVKKEEKDEVKNVEEKKDVSGKSNLLALAEVPDGGGWGDKDKGWGEEDGGWGKR